MTIEEQIYKRFIAAICRLKDVKSVTNHLLTEVSGKYLLKTVNSVIKLSIKLKEQDFLVQTAIITALMEASDTWQNFEELHKKQQQESNKINVVETTQQNTALTEYDKLLKGLLKVPTPTKKNKSK